MHKINFDVDVDNPIFQPEVDPIVAHSKIADVYQFRPPYEKEFFRRSSQNMRMTSLDNLLDLCCGRGELAIGFSDLVQQITGVDGSSEMLKHAIKHPKVNYQLADVNDESFLLDRMVNHIVIGSAIHWISGKCLSRIIQQYLKPGGHLLISHTLFKTEDQDYGVALSNINRKYGRVPRSVDLWGREKVEACGLICVDRLKIARRIFIDIESMYQNQLSYAYGSFHENISARPQEYKQEVLDTLSRFSSNGQIRTTLVNWGEIYSHPKDLI